MVTRLSVAKTILINPDGEALVLKRSEYKEHSNRSHQPDFPGGRVEAAESERTAAAREMLEETGIMIDEDTLTVGYTKTELHEDKDESVSRLLYIGRIDHTPKVTLSFEHEEYRWVKTRDLLIENKFGYFYEEAVEYLIKNKLI
jgi:8-oxo-dGTP pyrophosphatase MutT (NUDIX family)